MSGRRRRAAPSCRSRNAVCSRRRTLDRKVDAVEKKNDTLNSKIAAAEARSRRRSPL